MTDGELLKSMTRFRSLQEQVTRHRWLAEEFYMNHMHDLSWLNLFERELTKEERAKHWSKLRDYYTDAILLAEY